MAITAYTGLPGSGKSYGVVEQVVLPAIKKGRRLWTNIPLKLEEFTDEQRAQIDLFDIADIQGNPDWFQTTFEAGATLVIDECWRLWASGLKANNMLETHKSFLAEHRHMVGSDNQSTEIVFVTQDLAQLASYPRNLVESTYRAVKLIAVGQNNKFRIDIYSGAVTGPKPPEKSRLRQQFSTYKPDVYKYYTSQTMSESEGHGDETSTDDRTNILKGGFFRIGLPALCIFGALFFYYAFGQVTGMYGDEEEVIALDAAPVVSVPEYVPPPEPVYRHFFEGMDFYIAFNMGADSYRDYKIAFVGQSGSAVLSERELGKMGYRFIAYSECFGQLTGHGSSFNVFCRSEFVPEEKEPIFEL